MRENNERTFSLKIWKLYLERFIPYRKAILFLFIKHQFHPRPVIYQLFIVRNFYVDTTTTIYFYKQQLRFFAKLIFVFLKCTFLKLLSSSFPFRGWLKYRNNLCPDCFECFTEGVWLFSLQTMSSWPFNWICLPHYWAVMSLILLGLYIPSNWYIHWINKFGFPLGLEGITGDMIATFNSANNFARSVGNIARRNTFCYKNVILVKLRCN